MWFLGFVCAGLTRLVFGVVLLASCLRGLPVCRTPRGWHLVLARRVLESLLSVGLERDGDLVLVLLVVGAAGIWLSVSFLGRYR